MAATAALVFQGHNLLRYLITGDGAGGTATIPNDAGATPDLQTDAISGPLRAIARARLDGIGTVAAGALNQAQARALLLADNSTSVGNSLVPRARCLAMARSGTVEPAVDANVDGQGDPVVTCTVAANQLAYLDIEFVEGAIGS